MSRAPKAVESFGPEIMAALVQGATKRIVLQVPYRKAVHFRQRANALRAAMRNTNHTMYSAISQTTITITWPPSTVEEKSSRGVRRPKDPNTPCTLTIAPADSEFTDALTSAGVTIVPPKPSPDTGPGIGDDILSDYVKNSLG